MEEIDMKEEYNIKNLNPRKNPYAKKIKKPVTLNMNVTTIEYFKFIEKRRYNISQIWNRWCNAQLSIG